MDIKQITDTAAELIEEHMQAAIKSEDIALAEMRVNWAYGILLLWTETTFRAVQQERNLSRQNEMRRYRPGLMNGSASWLTVAAFRYLTASHRPPETDNTAPAICQAGAFSRFLAGNVSRKNAEFT